ncbi:pilus assembly protein [Geomonas terrae]|nr:PilC/PilY family type IV pilus protein [Geomonas terrae]
MKPSLLITASSLALALVLSPTVSHADPGADYCVTPAFVAGNIPPNLLLLIDNSASMYDLFYQDTTHTYCANSTTTACTSNTTCASLPATCRQSGTTTTSTVYSAKPCTSNSDCTASGSKCNSGFCTKCNANGVGDCVSQSTTIFTPTACTTDATCSAITSGDTCGNKCTVHHDCYDATYNNATPYSGYFDSDKTYSYDFTNNKFVDDATMPGTCSYSAGTTKYVCVNTTGAGTVSEAVVQNATGFVASGNFLNWLTASKFDIEKGILTGGKYEDNTLVAETRGCAGRKFVKSLPAASLTFAIRGGTSEGISKTTSQATEYGQTYIDISTGTYNASDCLAAMDDWMNVTTTNPPQLGAFQNDTKGCVGTSTTLANAVTASSVWNHILHDCYQGLSGGAQSYSTNLSALEGECKNIYANLAPNLMTDPNAGYAVCSSVLTYTVGGTNWQGYLGACWNNTRQDFSNCPQTSGDPNADSQVKRMANYCNVNINTNPVADPSSTSLTTAGQSAPGFILEQGLLNTQPVGTFRVRVATDSAPIGLLDDFKDRIRFGVQTFQNNGAGSECGNTAGIPCVKTCSVTTTRICYFDTDCPITNGTQETCGALTKRDGGQLLTYVGSGNCSVSTGTACTVDSDCSSLTPSGQYCKPSIGDHSTGMIQAIDGIPATSWTPFAESFYNALGYFARDNAYTANPPVSRNPSSTHPFPVLASPNAAGSYLTEKNPSQFRCQSNNILLITDGMSTADQNGSSEALASLYASQVPNSVNGTTTYGISGYDTANSCPPYAGSRSISDLTWIAKNRGIKTLATSGTASTTAPATPSESITTFVVYSGPQTSNEVGLCDPKTLMDNTARNGGTTLLSATDRDGLRDQIRAALSAVAAKAASGTAASILSNSEGSGANILQAVFFPKKVFENQTWTSWIGEMQNLWYFVDPLISRSTIREDTDQNRAMDLIADYVASFRFDSSDNTTYAYLSKDTNGDGVGDTTELKKDSDDVLSIWRAGRQLALRPLSATSIPPATVSDPARPRRILTSLNGTSLTAFSSTNFPSSGTSNASTLAPYLNVSATEAERLIDYTHGIDQADADGLASYRKRKVDIKVPTVTNAANRTLSYTTKSGTWRLGDIISSTPRVQSTGKLNTYNLAPTSGYNDVSYGSFIGSSDYKNRGMVYVGANDGMMHAFKLGLLDVTASNTQKATLSGTGLGEEQWAYIPKQALPYLRYYSDPYYNHLYYVDGSTLLFDASIGTSTACSDAATYYDCVKPNAVTTGAAGTALDPGTNVWRTILIGGMGIGGATAKTCTSGTPCVATPVAADPADNTKALGYSTYYALDVTDPTSPSLMWEFNDTAMGYATTGPAIVRVGDRAKNGHWYAVFGSGPTGPIDTTYNQFKGQSNQTLKFFIVDLRTGLLVDTIDTGIENAFAGSMLGASIDADRWDSSSNGHYQDDAIYVGYTKKNTTTGTWTDGGVIRIMTKESSTVTNWAWSEVVGGTGPVVTSISRLQDRKNKNLWLYFGSGRYYYHSGSEIDDNNGQRHIYGIKEPCYNTTAHPGNLLDKTCTATVTTGITDQSTSISTTIGAGGWKIDLDLASGDFGAERVVTDAVALTNGTVFLTSFMPNADPCGFGGNSYLWALGYDTGGRPSDAALSGKALIQLSTGEFKEIDLSSAFGSGAARLLRRTSAAMTGKPPADAFPIVSKSGNKPVKRIMHIQER